MIRHIVMWKLADTEDKRGKMLAIKENLEGLKNKIDVIKSIEVGINFNTSDTVSDIVLISDFETRDDLAKYISDPAHKAVGAALVKPNVVERRVVDYEY